MINETSSIDQIERQLSKLESTATNLQTISVLATRTNRTQEAKTLSDQAVDLRVKQFILYRNKDKLQIDTKEWKAFVSALELVNHFIDEAMADIKLIKEVQDSAARLISVATKIAATYADKMSQQFELKIWGAEELGSNLQGRVAQKAFFRRKIMHKVAAIC